MHVRALRAVWAASAACALLALAMLDAVAAAYPQKRAYDTHHYYVLEL